VFTGFGFVFSGNVDITGVKVDPTSAFSPIAGGLTFGATDIFVNLVGDAPAVGAALILDVTTGTPAVPEPSTWAMGLIGFGSAIARAAL
jgi:PEP-CTERM motif